MTESTNQMAEHLRVRLKSREPILVIKSKEEHRIEGIIRSVAASTVDAETDTPYAVRYWSVTEGIFERDPKGKKVDIEPTMTAPYDVLGHVAATEERALYILRDFHPYVEDNADDCHKIRRRLRDLTRSLKGLKGSVARAIILLSPIFKTPPELEGDLHLVDWPLPTQADLGRMLTDFVGAIRSKELKATAGAVDRDRLIRAMVGLTTEQASIALRRSLVEKQTLDPALITEEKRAAIGDDGVLEVLDPLPDGLAGLGGFDRAKEFALDRRAAFSARAREYGLDPQRGIFLAGVPGCGKTLLAQALAGEYGFFAVRLNVSAIFGQYVGQSEERFRRARQRLRILAPVLVLIDEIDKAIGGGGDHDGGTSARIKGEFLTWLQEKSEPESPTLKVATANNIEDLSRTSPELLRDGRWDALMFVDLPTLDERAQILEIHVRKRLRQTPALNFESINYKRVAAATRLFSGAELEAVVSASMFRGFRESRPTATEDLLAVAATKVPLATTSKRRIDELRAWGKTRAMPVSSGDPATEDAVEIDA